MRKNLVWSYLRLAVIPLMLALTGCENNNLWSKISGESSDPKTLAAQAAIALREHDYAKALDLYNRVLSQQPYNAEALYGAASAALGASGVNFGTLISNVLQQVNGSSLNIHGLGDVLSQSREHLSAKVNCGSADSILAGMDCDALLAVMPNDVLARLQIIVSGISDGTVNKDDTTMLIDLGILRVLYAGLLAANAGFINIENDGGDFDITAGANIATICDAGANAATTSLIIKNVAWSYALFNRVVTLLNLSGNPIVIQIRNDVKVAGDKIMDPAGPLADANTNTNCFDAGGPFDVLDIDQSNYLTVLQSGAFDPPQ